MKIFGKTLWGTKETKSSSKQDPNWWEVLRNPLGSKGSASNASGAMRIFRSNSAASIPIQLITNELKQMRPLFIIDGEVENQDTDAGEGILKLLNKPSRDWTFILFMESLATYVATAGVGYLWAGGNINRPPIALEPVSPEFVAVSVDGDGMALSYHVTTGPNRGIYQRVEKGRTVRYISNMFSELHIIRNLGTKNSSGLIPDSPLSSVIDEINIAASSNDYNLSILENGGALSMLFSLKGDLKDDQFQAAAEAIMKKYSGTSNAGAVAVVDAEDIDAKEFGVNPKDMGYKELQNVARRSVAMMYKIPPVLVVDENATFNNMGTAREMFIDSAVLPWAKVIFNGLEDFLFMRFGVEDVGANLWFNEFLIPSLRERRIREAELLKKTGVVTINEIRATISLEALSAEANVLYQPATMVPVATDQDTDMPKVLRDGD